MSFVDLLQAAQAQALADKLSPSEISVYEHYCREYSKNFNEPLSKVLTMDPEFVIRMVYAEQLSDWDKIERLSDLQDLTMSLLDPDYDAKKEKALREENQRIVEEERQRLAEGRAVHESLEKKKPKNASEDEEVLDPKLPQQGGLSANLIRQLQHSDNEG